MRGDLQRSRGWGVGEGRLPSLCFRCNTQAPTISLHKEGPEKQVVLCAAETKNKVLAGSHRLTPVL